jgi:hypothetical protein
VGSAPWTGETDESSNDGVGRAVSPKQIVILSEQIVILSEAKDLLSLSQS